ncbi:hypothetical protein FQR65_LT07920 [Abscondita terminalis]|nr:hypothetical protein FQR65_LT07920 [Abscondita terminalis]
MQHSSGLWREQLFKKLFITRDEQSKMKLSYFVTCPQLVDIPSQLPEWSDLIEYDEYAQSMHPDSLHNLVWICMNKKLSSFKCTLFEGLQYSVKNLNNCSAESLNVLDIESFIYLTTLTVQGIDDNKMYYNGDKPPLIPASITCQLSTLNQAKWFKAAYKVYKNECNTNLSEVRLNLIRGIEVVRCIGNHGIDVKLLVSLANTFTERAKKFIKQSEIEFNEARADLYWKAALPILEKLQKNQAVTYGLNRLFDYKSKEMSQSEISRYVDEAKLFGGLQFMKKKDYEKALHIFDGLKNPYATYHQSQIYRIIAEEQLNQNKENVTSEMRSQHVIFLSRSRDCLYLTLDRLRDPSVDRKHPLNKLLGTEIEKIERMLSRIDSDMYMRNNDCEGLSDENVSSIGSIGEHANNFYSSTLYPTESLTPHLDRTSYSNRYRLELPSRREARPSPERLDAQLRQMQASRDTTLGQIIEQNRLMVDSHRSLMDEFRWLKEAVSNITASVNDVRNTKTSGREELQSIKDSITELKAVVEEFQSFKDITDLVQEMKKEIAELKKDHVKSKNQLSEEDLYVLDDEYTADYGINANTTGFNPTNLYPNYQGRIPPTYPPAAALYPGIYPVYPYANLGIPPAGSLPFGQDADYRSLSHPLGLTQPTYPQHNLPQPKQTWDVTHPNLAQLNLVQPMVLPQVPPQLSQVTTQQPTLFKDTLISTSSSITSNIFSSAVTTATVSNTNAPINVVITSSDPVPKTSVVTTQVLSVTIPPQHLKGYLPPKTTQPHSYQIPLPTTFSNIPNTTPTIVNQPAPVVTTQGLLSSVEPPLYSAINTKNATLGLQIEKSLNQSFNTSADSIKAAASPATIEEDPCPDFKPIIPLPDEVSVNTGEENENILFSNQAKLFRFITNEWKERGVGVLKILQDKDTNKVRVLMRRDQVHKICANHFLTKDMNVSKMRGNNLAVVWAANDFADQQSILETFCAKFKTEDIANDFLNVIEQCKEKLPLPVVEKAVEENIDNQSHVKTSETATSLENVTPVKESTQTESLKSSPFASFTFGAKPSTTNVGLFPALQKPVAVDTSKTEEQETDFEPNVEFQPVVALPDLVDVKTGEENAEILFECHAKLLRYDVLSKQWKECGVGIMKLLKERNIRLVMRRDQVLKVCCNHQLLKNMQFAKMPNNPKAFSWCAQDYSDGTLQTVTFTIRFKSEDQAEAFYKAVASAKELLDDNNVVKSEEKDKKVKGEPPEASKTTGWGDKFKPKIGTWKCKTCFIPNEAKDHFCVACETPKNNGTPKKESEAVFSFGISPPASSNSAINKSQFSFGTPGGAAATTSFVFAQTPVSWGDAFKVKEGSWECSSCLVRNESHVIKCVSCESAKDPEKKSEIISWGDQFKPKEGSWECQVCLLRNDSDKLYCVSCESPKDDTVAKNDSKTETGSVQFKFGIPLTSTTPTSSTSFSFTTQPATSFTFGTKPVSTTTGDKFSFASAADESKDRFVFGSPQQHAFEFTPRSPRRHSSGCQGEEDADNLVEDEGDHIYFKPVIPLPDKIDVKTGEESEVVVYCHRAKLFRFVDGEWKERGIGDLKILSNTETKKLRVLMRREQVLKICLNHFLTSNIEYKSKDDKTWLFTAPDYSEGQINHWQFCVRFKTPDVAKEFKKAVDDALSKSDSSFTAEPTIANDTSEVEFVTETEVTPEEEQEAILLQLPPKFMSYRQLPDCTCTTCQKDDIILKDLLKKPVEKAAPTSTDIVTTPTTSKSILAKPKLCLSPESSTTKVESNPLKTFSFTLKTEAETTTTPATVNVLSSTPAKSLFSGISFTSPSTSGGNIFGSKPKTTFGPSGSIFGGGAGFNLTFNPSGQADIKKDEPILKCDSNLSFTNLPNANVLAFGKKFEEGDKPFAHLGSGAPVFASLAKNTSKRADKTQSGDEGEHSENECGDNYDPHYEPIVPLPDAIVVSTGEEDEVPVFNERAKLYRYDDKTKEWKERGVGQMKILNHPQNAAIATVKETRDKSLPSTLQNFGDVVYEHSDRDDDVDEDEEEEDDCDDDDEDERTLLFMKPCLLQEEVGDNQWNDLANETILIYYDPDTCCSRIHMYDKSGIEISNTLIGTNTEMMIEDNVCSWKAVQWADGNPRWQSLRATFSTYQDAEEFHCHYVDSLQFAHESGIVDQLIAGE